MEAQTIIWKTDSEELEVLARALEHQLAMMEARQQHMPGVSRSTNQDKDYHTLCHIYNRIITQL